MGNVFGCEVYMKVEKAKTCAFESRTGGYAYHVRARKTKLNQHARDAHVSDEKQTEISMDGVRLFQSKHATHERPLRISVLLNPTRRQWVGANVDGIQ